jgi:hypothetical protein
MQPRILALSSLQQRGDGKHLKQRCPVRTFTLQLREMQDKADHWNELEIS